MYEPLVFVTIVCGLLVGCTQQDDARAKQKLENAKQKLRHDVNRAGEEIKKDGHAAADELRKEGHEAGQETKKSSDELKDKAQHQ